VLWTGVIGHVAAANLRGRCCTTVTRMFRPG
jgi:hypothetical protein